VLPYLGGGFCDPGHRQDVETFLEGRVQKLPGGERVLQQTLEGMDLCIASRSAQEPGVREFLKGY